MTVTQMESVSWACQPDLNSGHVRILNGPNFFGWQMVLFSNGWTFLDALLYSNLLVLFLNGLF